MKYKVLNGKCAQNAIIEVNECCETPFDCLDGCELVNDRGKIAEFAEVEPLADAPHRLRIGARLELKGFAKSAINALLAMTDTKKESIGDLAQISASGNKTRIGSGGAWARISSTGYGARIVSGGKEAWIGSSDYGAQIISTGYAAQIASAGFGAQIASIGDGARIAASGDMARIVANGDRARISASGESMLIASKSDRARIAASGNDVQITVSGKKTRISASGEDAQIIANGDKAVISAIGAGSRAKGKIGSWIVLAEYDDQNNPLCVRAAQIDGDILLPDIFYTLRNGEFRMV